MCAMFNERDGKLLLARCERNNAATRATRGVRPVASTQPVAPVSAPAVSASPRTLRFTVPGKPVSLNRRFTPIIVKGKDGKERPAQTKAAEARAYQKRVRDIAFAECARARWQFLPAPVCVEIHAYGTGCDADSTLKYLMDGMNGLVYRDDKDVKALSVRLHDAKCAEPRLEITVTEDRANV